MNREGQKAAAALFGAAVLLGMIAIAILRPNPTPFQYVVFKTVLAVSAAGFVSALPGFFQAEVKSFVRFGGAFVCLVLLYAFSPAALVATPQPPKSHEGFLSALDDHVRRRVPLSEYSIKIISRTDVEVGRFWIEEITDDSWEGLVKKICRRYRGCMKCVLARTSVEISLPGELKEEKTLEGVKKYSCRA